MELQEGDVQLRDRQMDVVARVPDERGPLRVAWQVVRAPALGLAKEEEVGIVAVVEVGAPTWTGTIE